MVRRFRALLVTCWVALTVNFALPRLMPGNPVETMFARYQGKVSPSAVSAMELDFGLNTKTGELGQYFDYLGHTLTGNLGISFSYFPSHVSTLIGEALPWTLGLVGFATILAFLLGTTLGMVAAWRRGTAGWRRASLVDTVLVPFGLMLAALPSFWIALILLYFIAFKFGWFPIGGGLNPGAGIASWSGFASLIDHAALPAITLTFISMGLWILLMRNNMLTVLGDDYVKFARAKGLRDHTIAYRYAARNAILPVFSQLALALGIVVGGQVFIEIVYSYPGIGYLLLQAVYNEDYPLMQGIFLIFTITLLVASFLADVLYVFLDPRVRMEPAK
ncbi:MAG: ABC transporter permease [Acidimicrobiales bacterium]